MKFDSAIDSRTLMSRRRLLAGLSTLAAAVSSRAWLQNTAFGQDANIPRARRFIGIFSANGTVAREFFPPATAGEEPLALGRILLPLEAHRDKLLVLKGIHMNSTIEDELGVPSDNKPGGPHMKGPGAMLTGGSLEQGSFTGAGGPAGYADRISVDQYIAGRLGNETKFASLEFGVRVEGQEPLRVISYHGANQPALTLDDPFKMYARLFSDVGLSEAELTHSIQASRSVLDFLKADIQALAPRLANEDRTRLDAHLSGLRNVEQRLSGAANACAPLTLPAQFDVRAIENFEQTGRLQTDLMVLAHACDLTRVSTLMWANADSWQYFPFVGVNEEHHELSHSSDDDEASVEKLIAINTWHAEQTAYLLSQLAAAENGDDTSLLDDALVLWGNELGAGNTHSHRDIPWLLAGGAGGYFRMGRSLQYPDRPHNDLLVSVCNAMGLEDVTTFGIPGVCTGPLAELRA
jgi:hypothetical protein